MKGLAPFCFDAFEGALAIRCQAVGVARKTPPSGDEWLRGTVRLVRLPNKRASPSPAGGSKGPGDEGGDRATTQ